MTKKTDNEGAFESNACKGPAKVTSDAFRAGWDAIDWSGTSGRFVTMPGRALTRAVFLSNTPSGRQLLIRVRRLLLNAKGGAVMTSASTRLGRFPSSQDDWLCVGYGKGDNGPQGFFADERPCVAMQALGDYAETITQTMRLLDKAWGESFEGKLSWILEHDHISALQSTYRLGGLLGLATLLDWSLARAPDYSTKLVLYGTLGMHERRGALSLHEYILSLKQHGFLQEW